MQYKNKKRILIAIISVLSLIFFLSLSLFFYQKAYASKIFRNTFFDGVNLEGKTKAQAKKILENQVDPLFDNTIIVQSSNGKNYESTFSQTGAYFDADKVINEAFSRGRDQNFGQSLFSLTKTVVQKEELQPIVSFKTDEYNAYVERAQKSLNMPPVDASLSIQNGAVITKTGENGVTIDASGLQEQISNNVFNKSKTASIEIPTKPVTPTLLTEHLSSAKSTAESYLQHQLILTLADQTFKADTGTISSWIVFGLQEGKYNSWLDTAAMKSFISKIAAKNDVSVIDTKISAVDNTTVLQQGRQGIYIDQNDALSKIKAAMAASAATATIGLVQTNKDPQIIKVFPDEGIVPGRFPGKYIDVDLTKQLMTLFDGVNQVGQYVVSTGKASTPTPTGTRTVSGRDPKAWSAPFGLWMPWWMTLGGGYGIHELPEWPNGYKEGEAHLGTPVSHGCIRLGVGAAQTVYNWTPDGTQVYIHK